MKPHIKLIDGLWKIDEQRIPYDVYKLLALSLTFWVRLARAQAFCERRNIRK